MPESEPSLLVTLTETESPPLTALTKPDGVVAEAVVPELGVTVVV